MNLADYLSELLGQYEEVSVPGLGYFVRERVNGYYNDKEARFYPPYHRVKFVPQLRDDEIFAQYVADKKNISLASSKYFAEKFVGKLREQALAGKYLFADLGLFYTDQGQLTFKANDKVPDDPAFYGYPPMNAYKLDQFNNPYNKPVFSADDNAKPAAPIVETIQTVNVVQPIEDERYNQEEIVHKKSFNIWLIILLVLVILGIAAFAVYKFYPAVFEKYTAKVAKKDTMAMAYHEPEKKQLPVKKDTLIQKPIAVADTAKPAPVAVKPAVITPKAKDENTSQKVVTIIVGSFKTLKKAEAEVKRLQLAGVSTARVANEVGGTRKKVSAGDFVSIDEAETAKETLTKKHKIKEDSYLLPINKVQ